MKKLNQNNAIATTAMLTKLNTMKNKMNFFAKVVMLVAMMGMLVPQVAWGQTTQAWTRTSGTWYIFPSTKVDATYRNNRYSASDSSSTTCYFPAVNCTIQGSYQMQNNPTQSSSTTFYVNIGNQRTPQVNKNVTSRQNRAQTISQTYTPPSAAPQNIVVGFKDGGTRSNTASSKTITAYITLPQHLEWDNNTTSFGAGTIDKTTTTQQVQAEIDISNAFKSYYTNRNVTAKITGPNASMFQIGSANGGQGGTSGTAVVNNGSVFAQSSCFGGNTSSDFTAPSKIYYVPTSVGEHTATLTLTYGSTTKTFTLTGTCRSSQQVTWTANPLSSPYIFTNGNYSSIDLSQYVTVKDLFNNVVSSPGAITYSLSPTSNTNNTNDASISGSTLTFRDCNSISVYARSIAASGDYYLQTNLSNVTTKCQAKKVTPKLTTWDGELSTSVGTAQYDFPKADWAADKTADANQPAKSEWVSGEITIKYESADNTIAQVNTNGTSITAKKAGLTTITASIPSEKNHNAASNTLQKVLKVDFADDYEIDFGEKYIDGESLTHEITNDISLPNGGSLGFSVNDQAFSVDFSDDKIEVVYNPTSYPESSSGVNSDEITLTYTFNEVVYEFHLKVKGTCKRQTPTIEWIDNKLLKKSDDPNDYHPIVELLKSYTYFDGGVTVSSSDASVISVEGNTFCACGEGTATVTITIPATNIHDGLTALAEFTVTDKEICVIVWNQKELLKNLYVDDELELTAHVVNEDGEDVSGATISYTPTSSTCFSVSNGNKLTATTAGGPVQLTATATIPDGSDGEEYEALPLTYNVTVKPPKTDGCTTYIYESNGNITSAQEISFDTKDGTPYPAGTLTYNYTLAKASTGWGSSTTTITISTTGGGTVNVNNSYTQTSQTQSKTITETLSRDVTGLSFSGSSTSYYGGGGLDGNNYFSNVKVTQASYLEAGTTTTNDFGSCQTSVPKQMLIRNVAKYSNLNGPVRAIITSGNQYFKVIDSDQNHFGDGCGDFGNVDVMVEYVANDENVLHNGTLKLVGYIGATRKEVTVELTGKSKNTVQRIVWPEGFEDGATIVAADSIIDLSGISSVTTQGASGGNVTLQINNDPSGTSYTFRDNDYYTIAATAAQKTIGTDVYDSVTETRTFFFTDGNACDRYCLNTTITSASSSTIYSFAPGSTPVKMTGTFIRKTNSTSTSNRSSYVIMDNNSKTISSGSSRQGNYNPIAIQEYDDFDGTETGIKVTTFTRCSLITVQVEQKTDKLLTYSGTDNTVDFGEHLIGEESEPEEVTIEYWNLPFMTAELIGNDNDNFRLSQVVDGMAKCNCHGTTTYKIYFTPSAVAEATCTLKLTYSTAQNVDPITLTLKGHGKKRDPGLYQIGSLPDNFKALDIIPLTGYAGVNNEEQTVKYVVVTSSAGTEESKEIAEVIDNEDGTQSLKINKSGDFYLKAYVGESDTYTDASFVFSPACHADRATPTITLDDLGDVYVFSTQHLNCQTSSTGTITYSVDPEGIHILSEDDITFKSCTTTTIFASVPETDDGIYTAASCSIQVTPVAVTPTITFNEITGDAYANTDFELNGAEWASAEKEPAQPAKDDWTNEQVDIYYTTDLGSIADDGVTLTSAKAGYATITAHIDAKDNHTESDNHPTQGLKIDFATDFFLPCTTAVVGTPSTTTLDMTDYFVPSNTSYTVSSSSTEFVVTKQNNSNYITIQFSPTSVNNGDSDTEEKEATITITDNGQEYHFKVKATAEKKEADLVIADIENPIVFSTITPSLSNKATDATNVTYTYYDNNGTQLATGSEYKLTSINPIKIIATTSATSTYKAGTSEAITVTPQAVTPIISSFVTLAKGYVGTEYDLTGKADWSATEGHPARSEWVDDDGVVINYTSSNTDIAGNGTTFTPQKAGVTTITASIAAANYHNASTENKSKDLQIDFNQSEPLYTFTTTTSIGASTTEVIELANYFVPSGNYTVAISGAGFSIDGNTNVSQTDNKFSVKFTAPTFDASKENEDFSATVTITDTDGRIYSFTIKATAGKKDAGLTLSYTGETFAFSTITLSCAQATDATVAYSANGETITGNTYKIPSIAPVTITATSAATTTYKAGSSSVTINPTPVTPKVTNWSGKYTDQKVGGSCTLGQADWDVDETIIGQPAKEKWDNGEVTITYSSSNEDIARINGNNLEFGKAGVATITASIAGEKNHNASTNNPSKTVKVDFADEAVNCGTMYVGETPASIDITDKIVSAGTLEYTTTDNDFSVDFSNNKIVVKYNPSAYHETSSGTITFTDTDGQKYHLNVTAGCKKHTPVIEWRSDVQTIAIAQDENDIKTETDLIDATNSQYYQPLKFKSGDVSKVKVYDENYEEVEWGIYLYPIGKGPVTIYAKAEETESHYASAEASEKQFTIIGEAKSKIAWNQNFLRIYNDQGSIPLTAEVQASSNSAPIPGATVTYHLLNVQNNVVTLNGCTLNITAGTTGTAKIYAEFTGNDDYIGCVSETLNISVIARISGGCNTITYNDVTSKGSASEVIYYFNNNKYSAGEPYFEVEKITALATAKGDKGRGIISGDGASRSIKSTFGSNTQITTGPGGKRGFLDGSEPDPVTANHIYQPNEGDNTQFIKFSGDIGNNNSNTFTGIEVTPRSYVRQVSPWDNPFADGITEVGYTRTEQFTIATYSNLSDYDIALWEPGTDDRAYSGGEFRIISSTGDRYPITCPANNTVDFGEWKITVEFKPTSGKTEKNPHKCRIRITYKKGSNGQDGGLPIYLPIEAQAERIAQPAIIWNQSLSGLTSLSTKPTGEDWTSEEPIELTAKSGLSEPDYYGTYIAVDAYEITAGTDVAEVNGDQLSINKAGQFTIKAIHNGDDKYEPTSKERTIDIALSGPTIELSHNNGTIIAENETINVTYNDQPITIAGKAMYGDFEIYGYTIESGKIELSSSALDVVSIANDNQLQFLKSGDAVITATITEDDVVSSKTFTFYVHVNKAQAGLHWDDVTKYANDWIYVFETKSMTALADNNDNNGAISYDVTSGKASFSGNDITINGYGSITARAIIATTDKYLADTITNTFTPKMVTPVVSWSGSDFSTNLSNTPYTLTDEATVAASYGEPDVSVWTDGKTVVYSSTTPEVATLKQDNTFELHKVGYATIQAKVEAGDNNEVSNVVERHLKVDFDPEVRDFGTVSTYDSETININLGEEMKRLGVIYVSNISNSNFICGTIQNDILPITFKPLSHDSEHPEQTAEITIYDPGSQQYYHLYVKGTTKLFTPTVTYNNTKHNNWVFTTKPNPSEEDIRYSASDDIYCQLPGNISATDEKTANNSITLSLLNPTIDAEYVTISNNGKTFTVNHAKVDDDNPFTVYLVATYPGLSGMMEEDTLHIPITIQKSEQTISWIKTETIDANLMSKQILAPTLGITGGDSSIVYSYNPDGVVSIGGQTGNYVTLNLLNKKGTTVEITASIASDKYSKGCTAAPLTITINKVDQYVEWDGNEIINGFDTQRSTEDGIVLNAIAKYTTKATGANIKYNVVEQSNCNGEGNLIRLEENNNVKPRQTTLYYTGNGSGTVTIEAIAEATDEYNATKPNTQESPKYTFTITRVDCNVDDFTVANMRYGDKVVLKPTVDKFTRGENYEYTLPTVNGTLDTAGNVLYVKGVGNGLTISAKKLEDCWVTESANKPSNTFNIAKSEQKIEWDKTVLGTPQDGAYHFGVLDNNAYQLGTQAIDKLHHDADSTWLPLVEGKYVTANISQDAAGELSLVYSVVEQDGVCKVGDDKIVSVDQDGKMHITGNGTGTVLVIASVDGGNYYENVSETITVVVDKMTPTVTVTGPGNTFNYGTGPHTLTASSVADGGYSSADDPNASFAYTVTEGTDVASISGNQLTILKAGTVKVTATQAANCIVNSATSNEYTITITEASPELQFTVIPDEAIAYGDNTQSVKAESKSTPASTGAITYSSSNTNVATVDATTGVITPVSAGTFTVTASIAAVDGKWTAGQTTSTSITINLADPQLAWNVAPANATFDPSNNIQNLTVTEISDAAPVFSVTPVSPSTDGATIDAQSGVLTITKTGTYKVTVTLVETDKYNSASIEKTIVISKADADFFSIADITMIYNDGAVSLNAKISDGTLTLGTDYQVSYKVGSNGNDYFSVDDVNKTISPLKANVEENGDLVEMTLDVSIKGMTNYNDKQITGKVYVQRATQAIVWSDGIQTSYDTWNDGEEKTVTLDNHTQSQDASHDNNDITPDLTKTYELVISDKGCDIEDASVAYIDNDNVLHITGEASATLTIYAKQDGTDNNGENYTKIEKANNCTTVIAISKITPTISFERSNVNGGEDVYYSDEVTYTVSSTGTDYSVSDVSAFTFNVTSDDGGAISENVASHAGNVTIKASQAEDCMINGAESGEVNVEIKKAPQSVSWEVTDLGTLSATSTEGIELTATAMNSRQQNTPSRMTITYTVCDAQGNDITSGALITIGNDNKVYSANNGSGEAWVKAVANGNDNYEASETLVIKKITITNATPTIAWTDPCSEQMTMNYREKKQLTFSCNYTGYTASYSLTEPSDDTYVDMTELANGNVKIIGVKPDNGTIGIKVTISDPKGNYSDGELTTAISTLKNNTEIDWNGQSFGTYTTANAGMEIELIAFVKDMYKEDDSRETVAYSFDETNVVENCGNIVELTDEGKLKITGNAAGTVTLYANYAGDENYNASPEKSMQITVGKQTPSFAWEDDADIQATYGDVNVSAGEITKDGYGVVTYSSSKEDVAMIDQDGNITIEGAGTTTLSATLAADCKYEAVTTAITKTLTVNQATGTIRWVTGKEPHNGTYLTTLTEEVEATSNNTGDGSIEYSSSNKDVADFENGVLKIKKAGTTIITATRAATRNFTAASCSTTITISKATCTITVTAPQNITFGQTEALQYSTTNTDQNLQVTFTSGNTNIVSISGDQATGAGAGTTYVYAEIAESDNYLQATSDDFNITVTQASKIFTIADMSLTYGDQNKPITITDGGITGYTVSYSIADADKSYIEFNPDGTINAIKAHCDAQGNLVNIPVTARFTHTNYTIADVTFNVTVAKKSQTITWNETFAGSYDIFSKIMFNATTDADADASETNKVYYTWTQTPTSTCDDPVFGKGNRNDIINYNQNDGAQINAAGTVTVTARHDGNENYLPDSCSSKKTFTINKVTPTLNWNTEYTENQTSDSTISLVATSNFNRSNVLYKIDSMTVEGCASLNGNQLTCNKPGEVTVRAYQEAIPCVIDSAGILQTIKIGQGPHEIKWNKSKAYSVNNLAGTIDLSNYCKCSTCSTCLITYSIDGTTGVSLDTDGHTIIIDEKISNQFNLVVTASVAGDNTYEASSNDTTFIITVESLTITVNGGSDTDNPLDLSAAEPYVTSVTDNVDLAQKLVDNEVLSSNYKNVTYTFASDDTNIATFNTDYKTIIAYKRSDALKLTVTATVDENRKCSKDFWVKIPRGTMVFNRDGNWDDMLSDGSNWHRRDLIPTKNDHNVSIAANCTVNDATTAECWDMEIANNGTLTISKAGILNVADTILNNDESKLRIEADANGQGTLVFHNKKTMPMATVEMWCKGSEGDINPNWQYRGIAVSSATLPSDENAPDLIYQWTEAAHASDANTGITEQWTKVTDNTMSAWTGYAVAKYTSDGADYKTSAAGALTNDDKVINLAYTATQQSGNGVQTGFNLITNSYTAPIRISDIVFGDEDEEVDDVMKGIVLFNTGKYVDWRNSDKEIREGNTGPGQYLFLPKYTAEQIATTELIPSGESFFVVAYQTDKTVQIPYSAVDSLKRSGPLKMPERREVYGKLIIEVDGGEGADRLYLLENENRIRGFENGYDGPKYAGTKGNPMLYATTDDGRMCVSADSSLLGQYIGFAAGKHDVTYTMTFDASALSGYSELYLYDTREKRYTNILDGGSYTFKGLVSGEDRRFKIVGSREDGKSVTGDDQTIIVTGNRFHVTGYDNADERIYLVDMTGKILWETSTAFGPWFDIPTDIPAGVYVIKTGNHTAKMAVK